MTTLKIRQKSGVHCLRVNNKEDIYMCENFDKLPKQALIIMRQEVDYNINQAKKAKNEQWMISLWNTRNEITRTIMKK